MDKNIIDKNVRPLSSGRTIFALKPLDSTKIPEKLEKNSRDSPAAAVALVCLVEFAMQSWTTRGCFGHGACFGLWEEVSRLLKIHVSLM